MRRSSSTWAFRQVLCALVLYDKCSQAHLLMLHSKVTVNATSRVPEGAPGHSVLQHAAVSCLPLIWGDSWEHQEDVKEMQMLTRQLLPFYEESGNSAPSGLGGIQPKSCSGSL